MSLDPNQSENSSSSNQENELFIRVEPAQPIGVNQQNELKQQKEGDLNSQPKDEPMNDQTIKIEPIPTGDSIQSININNPIPTNDSIQSININNFGKTKVGSYLNQIPQLQQNQNKQPEEITDEKLKEVLTNYLKNKNEDERNNKIQIVNEMMKEIHEDMKKEEEKRNKENFEKQVEEEFKSDKIGKYENEDPMDINKIDEFTEYCEYITKKMLRKDLKVFHKRYSKDTKINKQLNKEIILKILKMKYNSIFLFVKKSIIIIISDKEKNLDDEMMNNDYEIDETFEVYCVKYNDEDNKCFVESIKNKKYQSYCYDFETPEFLHLCGMFSIEKNGEINFFDFIFEQKENFIFKKYLSEKEEVYDGEDFEFYNDMKENHKNNKIKKIQYIVCGNWEKRKFDEKFENKDNVDGENIDPKNQFGGDNVFTREVNEQNNNLNIDPNTQTPYNN